MVQQFRGSLNNFPTAISGGYIPDDIVMLKIDDWAEALEPRKTPLLTMFGMGDPIDTRPYYWGQSYLTQVETNTAEALDNSETGVDVTTGTGVIGQKWLVIEVVDFKSGSTTILDDTTAEQMQLTADPTTDTWTVERGYAGTTAVSHSSGAAVFLLSTAEPQNESHSLSPVARGTRTYNYVQRLSGGVSADISAQHTPTWENKSGNQLYKDFEAEQIRQKFFLEMQMWRGKRYAGTPTKGATFGGIDVYLTSNVTNMNGAKFTPMTLENELRDITKHVDGGADGLILVMGYDAAAIFDRLLDPLRMATPTDTTLSMFVETIKYRFGTFQIMTSHNARPGSIWGIRPENFKIRPYEGANWHISKKDGSVHGVDHDQIFTSGDFTLEVQREASMFKITNFNQDLTQYNTVYK